MYHVALPVFQSKKKGSQTIEELKKPSATTQLSQTICVKPFCLARFPGPIHHHGKVAWLGGLGESRFVLEQQGYTISR